MTPGELIGQGRQADVFAIDRRRVLRRYRDGTDTAREAEIMAYLSRFDFPLPRVYGAAGPEIVLERLDGTTMTAALTSGRLAVADAAACLAGLHRRRHALPPRPGSRQAVRILHRDLHPDNVLLTSRGPVVIDWTGAAEGPPDVDVALTAIIVAQVAADPGHPFAGTARSFVAAFLAAAGGVPGAALDVALAIRRADPSAADPERVFLAGAAALIERTGEVRS